MKFYRMIEITEGEYFAMTGDTAYNVCYQCVVPYDDVVYIAIDEDEETLEIDMADLLVCVR